MADNTRAVQGKTKGKKRKASVTTTGPIGADVVAAAAKDMHDLTYFSCPVPYNPHSLGLYALDHIVITRNGVLSVKAAFWDKYYLGRFGDDAGTIVFELAVIAHYGSPQKYIASPVFHKVLCYLEHSPSDCSNPNSGSASASELLVSARADITWLTTRDIALYAVRIAGDLSGYNVSKLLPPVTPVPDNNSNSSTTTTPTTTTAATTTNDNAGADDDGADINEHRSDGDD
jgi:hypothetical protein